MRRGLIEPPQFGGGKMVCGALTGTALGREGFPWTGYFSFPERLLPISQGYGMIRVSIYRVRTLMMSLAVAVLLQPLDLVAAGYG